MVLLRGDHSLDETKIKHFLAADQVKILTAEEAKSYLTSDTQLRSPIELADSIQLYADQHVQDMANLIVPAAEKQSYFLNANVGRDFQPLAFADFRLVQEGDPSPDGKGTLTFTRGIRSWAYLQVRNQVQRGPRSDGCR